MKEQYGPWKIIEKKSKNVYKCQCTCGLNKRLSLDELEKISDNTTCKHIVPNRKDLTGQHFGDWIVLKPTKSGYYLCQCSCENKTIKEIYGTTLRSGKSKSCGHSTTGFKDLKNMNFGEWTVLRYLGNHYWECQCSCENKTIKPVHRNSLLNGLSTSCGCKTVYNIQKKLMNQGVIHNRTDEQLKIVSTYEGLKDYIETFDHKPTINELSSKLNLNRTSIGVYIHKYNLEDYIDINPKTSNIEKEVLEEIRKINENIEIILRDKEVLLGQELDIYLHNLKLAIEVNGNYWHSTIYKNKYYHQNKTLACMAKGIQLIHIFEYEWNDVDKHRKLLNLIRSKIDNKSERVIYARNTEVTTIGINESNIFAEEYHLQGSANSSIQLGLYSKDNELLAVMTFGTPRFNSNFEYELIRLTYKSGVRCIGGTEKLFKYFINNYNPSSIISYCDITKFTGEVYSKLGFVKDKVTQPNYVWCDTKGENILTRYQTQKQKLLKLGLGTNEQTEDEIMYSMNFLKIYDSGNKVFTWHNSEDNQDKNNV